MRYSLLRVDSGLAGLIRPRQLDLQLRTKLAIEARVGFRYAPAFVAMRQNFHECFGSELGL